MNIESEPETLKIQALELEMPEFKVSKQIFELLRDILDLSDEVKVENLKTELNELGRSYLNARNVDSNSATIKTQNTSLRRVERKVGELRQLITSLDWGAEYRLGCQLDRTLTERPEDRPCSSTAISHSLTFLHLMEQATSRTRDDGWTRPGRQKDFTLGFLVNSLINIFERYSGNWYTHNDKVNGEFKSRLLSKGGRFLTTYLADLDPKIKEGTLVEYSASFVKTRPKRTQ
jgi:hypothetical protein